VNRNVKKYWTLGGALFLMFIVFTLGVTNCDVGPIGPEGTTVGFASLNRSIHEFFGVQMIWYTITDWFGVIAILTAFGYAAVGMVQLIRRKSIRKVDGPIVAMGFLYLLVIAFYLFFEWVVINYRPVLLDGVLEVSYPSSHTMLVVSVMAAAAIQQHTQFPERRKQSLAIDVAAGLIIAVTVVGRLLSGVHWFTDIAGGVLLSSALTALYRAVVECIE